MLTISGSLYFSLDLDIVFTSILQFRMDLAPNPNLPQLEQINQGSLNQLHRFLDVKQSVHLLALSKLVARGHGWFRLVSISTTILDVSIKSVIANIDAWCVDR
jgi:hypothetical protein